MASDIRIRRQDGGLHVACGIAYTVRLRRFEPTAVRKPYVHTDVDVGRKHGACNIRKHCIDNSLLNLSLNSEIYLSYIKYIKDQQVKVKVTLVQELRVCTGRTAYRASRGIALLFHDQRH
jgi:hypothetical protein